ncbi:divalent-cation tolerance protein CutA [Paucidesulfovibrio longus]|uniref:divalent-cation tolerance protein CutA n=1 Tax=Paucidesulfovibrio longus TaxID=889 RepID=UPI0003B6F6D4|nr:divalent-cation tolerance protein CutA [Paucidesulfovibrio longus]
MDACRLVYITAPDMAQAERIGAAIVERRLAACVNILPGMRSLYHWQGKVEQGEEVVVIAKTRAELVDRLTEAVVELHPYECPCVVSLRIESGHPAFLRWISEETS